MRSNEASGVLVSHGARFGGHTLFVKDRKLKYVYSFVGNDRVHEGDPDRAGDPRRVVRQGRRRRDADHGHALPVSSTTRRIITQPGNFSLVGEGLNVGKDPAEPVTNDYPGTSPFAFSGGTIKEAIVDVSGEHYVDIELEALAMMKRE